MAKVHLCALGFFEPRLARLWADFETSDSVQVAVNSGFTPQTCLGNSVVPGNLCEVKMCKLVNLYTSTEDMKIFCEIHSEATIVCTASFLCL